MEDKTDWARVNALTDEEIIAAVESDPDAELIADEEWKHAFWVYPKRAISIRLDSDIIDFFKEDGRGYQTRINAVLREYMRGRGTKPKPSASMMAEPPTPEISKRAPKKKRGGKKRP